jgi:hypothetical protein
MKRLVVVVLLGLFLLFTMLISGTEDTVTGQAVYVPLEVSQEEIMGIENVQELFIIFDTNNDDQLSKKEFEEGISIMLN